MTGERIRERQAAPELEQFDGTVGIMVDLDGTGLDHYLASLRIIQEELGVALAYEEITAWEIASHPKVVAVAGGPDFVRQLYEDLRWGKQVYEEAEPYPGAVETLNRWHDDPDYRPFFATSRLNKFTPVTHRSLQANGLGWAVEEGQIFLRPEGEDGLTFKNRLAKEQGAHIIVDDHVQLVQGIEAPTLMVRVIPVRPWNEVYERKGIPQTVFARDWEHMDELVVGFAGEISQWLSFLARLRGED